MTMIQKDLFIAKCHRIIAPLAGGVTSYLTSFQNWLGECPRINALSLYSLTKGVPSSLVNRQCKIISCYARHLKSENEQLGVSNHMFSNISLNYLVSILFNVIIRCPKHILKCSLLVDVFL